MLKRLILFLIINFAALALGGLATNTGVSGDWYTNLNQAPWTPPGWVFGAAWTAIMICFSIYLAYLYNAVIDKKTLLTIFGIQWILNVAWNPIFFHFHKVLSSLIVISCLTLIIFYLLIKYWNFLKEKSILILPYAIWLCIATSLNAFIFFNN